MLTQRVFFHDACESVSQEHRATGLQSRRSEVVCTEADYMLPKSPCEYNQHPCLAKLCSTGRMKTFYLQHQFQPNSRAFFEPDWGQVWLFQEVDPDYLLAYRIAGLPYPLLTLP